MSKRLANLQDGFLNQIRKENSDINIILLDGSNLSGRVRGFDNFTVVLENENYQHLIYKHAIAQILYKRGSHPPINLESHERHQQDEQQPRPPRDRPPPRHNPREASAEGPPRGPAKENPQDSKDASKKGGFNTLDLSKVVITDGTS